MRSDARGPAVPACLRIGEMVRRVKMDLDSALISAAVVLIAWVAIGGLIDWVAVLILER